MDKIIIEGLQLNSLIGVYDWERHAKQALLADVIVHLDLAIAARTDDVSYTVDYAALAAHLEAIADSASFSLLEALAGALIDGVFERYPARKVELKLSKPGILPNARLVSVYLTRESEQ